MKSIKQINDKTCIIASDKSWIEGLAIEQLKLASELSGVERAAAMPDLHPGNSYPIGVAIITKDIIYPYLIGSDIGCGMGLFKTTLKANKVNLDKLLKKLNDFEDYQYDIDEELYQNYSVEKTAFDFAMGTIGGGNHFAELQSIEKVFDQRTFDEAGLDKKYAFILVHSGSRSYGKDIIDRYIAKYKAEGILVSDDAGRLYLKDHDNALNWAKLNRRIIADKFAGCISTTAENVIDLAHNSISAISENDNTLWLHRKGAAPSNEGLVIIPGSRGSLNYLVKLNSQSDNTLDDSLIKETGYSLAHGAGRKWARGQVKSRIEKKQNVESLKQTKLGSRVICSDKEKLYDEAPEAYKNINTVISDMVDLGLIEVLAALRPLITFKTGKGGHYAK